MHEGLQLLAETIGLASACEDVLIILKFLLALLGCFQFKVLLVDSVHVAMMQVKNWMECSVSQRRHWKPATHVNAVVRRLQGKALPIEAGGCERPVFRHAQGLSDLGGDVRPLELRLQGPVRSDPGVSRRCQLSRLVWCDEFRRDVGEMLPDDLGHHLPVHLRHRPIPIGQADVAIVAEGLVRLDQCLLQVAHITPVPGRERLLAVLAEVVRPAVVSRDAEELRGLRARLVLHQLLHGHRPPCLICFRHLADFPSDHRARLGWLWIWNPSQRASDRELVAICKAEFRGALTGGPRLQWCQSAPRLTLE
mmetsp:Transcript_150526/g.483946  ORF Transcript_150526/g.483946 Transcript_150526/m.483946 type:complete len:308 (+) Transcript_150526:1400-2323(+)